LTTIAVIGCGQWGPNHIRNFNSLLGSRVAAAVDTDPARLARVRGLFRDVACSTDYRTVLQDPAVDAVVISTPLKTHYELTREALLAGKHVLCEKPLCETAQHAEALVQLAAETQRVLMVGHVFLFNPGIIKLKELVEAGELGRLHYLLAIRTNLGPIRDDCNAAYDLASHDVSIFNWLLGREPLRVSASGGCFLRPKIEDVVSITLHYPGNVFASIQCSWLNPKKVRHITVVGSRKMLTWDDLDLSAPVACYDKGADFKQEYNDFGEFLRVATWDGEVRLPKVEWEEPVRKQARHFLEAVSRGFVERSDGMFSVGVVRVLEAIAESLSLGGAPTDLARGRAAAASLRSDGGPVRLQS